MRSPIELLLPPSAISNLSFEELSDLSQIPLKMAKTKLVTVPEGIAVIQTISHYLANIQLCEYKTNNHYLADFDVPVASFFMIATVEGCSVLYNEAGNALTEISGNCCKLTYLPAGRYQRSLIAGDHKILLLGLKPEWLTMKYEDAEEFEQLFCAYNKSCEQIYCMPGVSIGSKMFSALSKLNSGAGGREIDIDMHIFLNDCIGRYYSKLKAGNQTSEYHSDKIKEITGFINKNFASKIVDDEKALARHFMVSEKTLRRLCLRAFGIPLHKQVIECRMLYGLKTLMTSKLAINEIAAQMGYADPYYFSRAFKNRFGVSPSEVRII